MRTRTLLLSVLFGIGTLLLQLEKQLPLLFNLVPPTLRIRFYGILQDSKANLDLRFSAPIPFRAAAMVLI